MGVQVGPGVVPCHDTKFVPCHNTKFVSWLGRLEGQGGLCRNTPNCIVTEIKAR